MPHALPSFVFDFENRLVFVDGVYSAQHSLCSLAGVQISDLKEQGVSVVIDGSISGPLHIMYVCLGGEGVLPKTTISAEKFSKAQIIEFYASDGDIQCPTHSETNMVVKESAEIHHFSFSFAEKAAHHDIRVTLDAPQAFVSLDGLYVAKDQQRVEYHTAISHKSPHTTSRQLYKGILNGEARVVFDGKIVVSEGAVFTDATQLNKNLLLSKKAQVETQPQLEIANNEVKCTHGATVGQMDAEEIFYFESRGIPKDIATSMLIHGFVDDVLERLHHDKIKIWLGKLLEERFFHGVA